MTALMLAAERGRADCARLLLDAGADKEATHKVRVSVFVVWALLLLVVMFWLCLEARHTIFIFSFLFLFLCLSLCSRIASP